MSKKIIYKDREMLLQMQRKGKKVKSHGTFRAKRHPTSPRLKGGIYAS